MSVLADSLTVLAQRAQEVRCVNCDDGSPSPVEWVGAVAGVIGGVAAVIALVMASASAKEAKRSAEHAEATANASKKTAAAAERTARAAEEETALTREAVEVAREERARRAVVAVEVARGSFSGAAYAPEVELTIGLRNDGSIPARRVMVNAVVPRGISLGMNESPAWISHSSLSKVDNVDIGRGPEEGHFWNGIVDYMDPGNSYVVSHLCLSRLPDVDMPMLVTINHSMSGQDEHHYFTFVVPRDGAPYDLTVRRGKPDP